MKILITGNKEKGLANALSKIYLEADFFSRENNYDLTLSQKQKNLAERCLEYDTIIVCSALWKFNQVVLLDEIYQSCIKNNHRPHIISIGSTTDRVKNGKAWLYNAEKKALRDYSNTLGIGGVWGSGPRISLISFGSLSNVQHKHPDRKCLDIDLAAAYIKWVIDQPKHLCINEISIDPMQVLDE